MSTIGRIFTFAAGSAPTTYTLSTYAFTANTSLVSLNFAMQADEGNNRYWLLDNVSVNRTNTNTNVLINGNFETGDLTGWTQYCATTANCAGALFFGRVTNTSCYMGKYCYVDKCDINNRFDYLTQSFTTVIGESYIVSFYLRLFSSGGGRMAYVSLT